MTCLNDKQIEQLVARPDDPGSARLREHVDACGECRRRLADAIADAALLGDVRELRERREGIQPLVDEMSGTGEQAKYMTDRV